MSALSKTRLDRQLAFLAELDKLKDVLRRSLVAQTGRRENSAEHSWHLAMMALVLLEHANLPEIDQLRLIKMLLIHDIVEIDAGDTFVYDLAGSLTKADREKAAATRIFSLLPSESATEFRELWDEFELGESPESRLAQGFDRMQPVLQNLRTGGASWREHGVTKAQVLEYNKKIGAVMPEVWQALVQQLDAAEASGFFH